jgi:hypothetical protein
MQTITSKLHDLPVVVLHVGDKRLRAVHLVRIVAAARAPALALVVLIEVESPQELLAAAVEVRLQVLVELWVRVYRCFLLIAHGPIELALDALNVTFLPEQFFFLHLSNIFANLLQH